MANLLSAAGNATGQFFGMIESDLGSAASAVQAGGSQLVSGLSGAFGATTAAAKTGVLAIESGGASLLSGASGAVNSGVQQGENIGAGIVGGLGGIVGGLGGIVGGIGNYNVASASATQNVLSSSGGYKASNLTSDITGSLDIMGAASLGAAAGSLFSKQKSQAPLMPVGLSDLFGSPTKVPTSISTPLAAGTATSGNAYGTGGQTPQAWAEELLGPGGGQAYLTAVAQYNAQQAAQTNAQLNQEIGGLNLPAPFISKPSSFTTIVPEGNTYAEAIPNSKIVYESPGEYGIYQEVFNPGGTPFWNLVGGGSVAALQSGAFTAIKPETPVVFTQASAGTSNPILATGLATYPGEPSASAVLANPSAFSRLGSEAYGGYVLPLNPKTTVQSTGAELSTFANPYNLANLVNPQAVNLPKSQQDLYSLPWSISASSPAIQVLGAGGLKPATLPGTELGNITPAAASIFVPAPATTTTAAKSGGGNILSNLLGADISALGKVYNIFGGGFGAQAATTNVQSGTIGEMAGIPPARSEDGLTYSILGRAPVSGQESVTFSSTPSTPSFSNLLENLRQGLLNGIGLGGGKAPSAGFGTSSFTITEPAVPTTQTSTIGGVTTTTTTSNQTSTTYTTPEKSLFDNLNDTIASFLPQTFSKQQLSESAANANTPLGFISNVGENAINQVETNPLGVARDTAFTVLLTLGTEGFGELATGAGISSKVVTGAGLLGGAALVTSALTAGFTDISASGISTRGGTMLPSLIGGLGLVGAASWADAARLPGESSATTTTKSGAVSSFFDTLAGRIEGKTLEGEMPSISGPTATSPGVLSRVAAGIKSVDPLAVLDVGRSALLEGVPEKVGQIYKATYNPSNILQDVYSITAESRENPMAFSGESLDFSITKTSQLLQRPTVSLPLLGETEIPFMKARPVGEPVTVDLSADTMAREYATTRLAGSTSMAGDIFAQEYIVRTSQPTFEGFIKGEESVFGAESISPTDGSVDYLKAWDEAVRVNPKNPQAEFGRLLTEPVSYSSKSIAFGRPGAGVTLENVFGEGQVITEARAGGVARLNQMPDISDFILSAERTTYQREGGNLIGMKTESVIRTPTEIKGTPSYAEQAGDYFVREISPEKNDLFEGETRQAGTTINRLLGSRFPAKGEPTIGEGQGIIQNALDRIAVSGRLSSSVGRIDELEFGKSAPSGNPYELSLGRFRGGGRTAITLDQVPQGTVPRGTVSEIPDYMKSANRGTVAVEKAAPLEISYSSAITSLDSGLRESAIPDLSRGATSAPRPASTRISGFDGGRVLEFDEEETFAREAPVGYSPLLSVRRLSAGSDVLTGIASEFAVASTNKSAQRSATAQSSSRRSVIGVLPAFAQVQATRQVSSQALAQRSRQRQRTDQATIQGSALDLDNIVEQGTMQGSILENITRQSQITRNVTTETTKTTKTPPPTDIFGLPPGASAPGGFLASNSKKSYNLFLEIIPLRSLLR